MSIATEIERIQTDRNTIRAKSVELGIAREDDNLDQLAAAIEGIAASGELDITLDGLTAASAAIPAGYTTGGTVSLTDDIEKALAAV